MGRSVGRTCGDGRRLGDVPERAGLQDCRDEAGIVAESVGTTGPCTPVFTQTPPKLAAWEGRAGWSDSPDEIGNACC